MADEKLVKAVHIRGGHRFLDYSVRPEYIEELKIPVVIIAQPILSEAEIVTMADTKHAWVKIPLGTFQHLSRALNESAAIARKLSGPIIIS